MKREKLKLHEKPPSVKKQQEISEREMYSLVHRFFIPLEKESENWWEQKGRKLSEEELGDVLDTLCTDEQVYRGGSLHYREAEGDPMGESLSREGADGWTERREIL
jgi:hypothetical protein